MLVEVQTIDGHRKIRVCDYCKTVCIPSGRFCSGHCSRNYYELPVSRDLTKDIKDEPAPFHPPLEE